jgi:hypothetical protein
MVMAAPLLPKNVRVHGRNFEIRMVDDDLDSGNAGVCHYTRGMIALNSDPEYVLELPDCVLHELSHAICYFGQLNLGENEERVVHILASGIVQVFADNPELGKWFFDAVKKL